MPNRRTKQDALLKFLWLGLVVSLISACGITPRHLEIDHERQAELRLVDRWQAAGKLGVRINGDAQSAYFDWRNDGDSFTLRLSGPFGQGTTWLRREGRLVTLEAPDAPIQQAATAEQLMQSQLGWQVPVSNLRYWVKGIAAPAHKVNQLVRNNDGTLVELEQQGWHIAYSQYKNHNGWALPGKLTATRGDVKLTVIIKSWELSAPERLASQPLSLLEPTSSH